MDIRQHSLLNFGFDLTYQNSRFELDLTLVDKKKYINHTELELIQIGSKVFGDVIQDLYIKENKKIVVPISGGLDSRAILSALIELTPAYNINTYTFGTPGTYDYDIGNLVAKKMGTKHVAFDLNKYVYSFEELSDIARRNDYQTTLFHYPPIKDLDALYSDKTIWSGFFGDPSSGSKLILNDDGLNSKEHFIKKNLYANQKITSISLDKFNEHILLPHEYLQKGISVYETIDFCNRQFKYIAPHVLIRGFNYITPFTDKRWIGFILSIDDKYRINQNLFKKMLISMFPDAFSIKTKNMLGLPLKVSNLRYIMRKLSHRIQNNINKIYRLFKDKNINYIDFEKGFKTRDDLLSIINHIEKDYEFKRNYKFVYRELLNNHMNDSDSKKYILLISFYFNSYLNSKQSSIHI